jgi:hypothetical protein
MLSVEPALSTESAIARCKHLLFRRFGVVLVPKSEYDKLPDDAPRGTRCKHAVDAAAAFVFDDSSPLAELKSLAHALLDREPNGVGTDDAMKLVMEACEREVLKARGSQS